MATNEIGDVEAKIGLDTGDVEEGVAEANKLIDSFGKKIKQVGQSLRDAFQNLTPKRPVEVDAPEIAEPEAVEAYSAELRDAEKSARALVLEMNRIAHASEMGFRNYGQVLRFSESVQQADQSIADAKAQLDALAQSQIPTEEYANLQKAIEQSDQSLAKLYSKQENLKNAGVDAESAQWQKLAAQIAQAEEEASYLAELKERMESEGSAFINPEDTAQYKALNDAIETAQQRLETNRGLINEEAIAQARLNVLTAQEAVAAATSTRERERAMQKLQEAQNELAYIANKNTTPTPDPNALTGWEAFGAQIDKTGDRLKKAIGDKAKQAFSAMQSGIKHAFAWLKNLRSHTSSAGNGVSGLARSLTSLKTMLIGRIKRSFVSEIMNACTEGIKALAQFDSAVDKSISNMKNGLRGVGANLAVSLGTIINTISPIITAALDAISAALTKLNALLAALRGAKTVTVAKKQTDSYAASLSSAAGNAGKAAKAQKKLNQTLTNYDELHKLSDNSDDNAGAGGSDLFTNVPVESILSDIPDGVQDMMQRLKEAVMNGDWYGVGTLIAQGLNGVVSALDNFILRVKTKAVAAAGALAQGLNGFIENFDFKKLGTTIGDGIGTVVSAIGRFVSDTNWGGLGKGVAEGVNGIFEAVNWKDVGELFSSGLNGVIDFAYDSITTANWTGYAESLGTAVSTFITNTDWAKAGRTIGEAFKGIFNGLSRFLATVDWAAVARAVVVFLGGIDWGGVAAAIFRAIGTAIGAAAILIFELGGQIISAIKNAIKTKIEELGWADEGDSIIMGILKGMLAALIGIGEWIIDNIFIPIWEGIKSAFGISSPAKEMLPLGVDILKGILEGILSVLGSILSFFAGLPAKIWHAFTGALGILFSAGTMVVQKIWDGLKSLWNSFVDFITGLPGKIWDAFTGAIGVMYDAGRAIVNRIWDGVKSIWNSFKDFLSNAWSALGDLLGSLTNKAFEAGKAFVDGIKRGMEWAWEGLKSLVSAIGGSCVDTLYEKLQIHSPSKIAAEAGEYFIEGLSVGIEGGKNAALQATADVARSVTNAMSDNLTKATVGMDITARIDDTSMDDATKEIWTRSNALTVGLSNIAEKLAVIADRFAGIQIAMPEPALGTVIPARARISDVTLEPTKTNNDLAQKLQMLIELLTAQQGKDSTVNISVPVKLDQRQIGEAVAKYTLSGQRITNGGLR